MTLDELKARIDKAKSAHLSAMDDAIIYDDLLLAAPALIACVASLKACRRELQCACNAANYMSDEMAEALKNSDEALRRLEGVK